MYKIKVDVKITEGTCEVESNSFVVECDDYRYELRKNSKPDYDHRYIKSVGVTALWNENPDRVPKDK